MLYGTQTAFVYVVSFDPPVVCKLQYMYHWRLSKDFLKGTLSRQGISFQSQLSSALFL